MTTAAIRHAKLQSNRRHQHPTFYTADALPVAQPTVSDITIEPLILAALNSGI